MSDTYDKYVTATAINQAKRINSYFETLSLIKPIYAVVSKRAVIDNVESYEEPIVIESAHEYNVFVNANEGVYTIAMKTYYGIGIFVKSSYYQPLKFKKIIADSFRPLFETVVLN